MRNLLLACVLAAAACGNGGDDIVPIDAFDSQCGHPGDTGNEVGVGKFCQTLTDCGDNMNATLCSSLGDATTHFCTMLCTPPGGDAGTPTDCGTGAECVCDNGGSCGCVPSVCLN